MTWRGFFLRALVLCALTLTGPVLMAQAADAPAAPPPPPEVASTAAPAATTASRDEETRARNTTAAAAAVTLGKDRAPARAPDFLENLVDGALRLFHVKNTGGNTTAHFVISLLFVALALLLRRVVAGFLFRQLQKLAALTRTTLDDKLFPALEPPVATLIMLLGLFAALKVLKLSAATDQAVGYAATTAFSLVVFWGLLRAFSALLDHAQEVAAERKMNVAAFMPWIKKTLLSLFVVFGVLMLVQSLGFNVKAFLAGLGIGGLAIALAAQDTLANLFGSIVVAIDQPFKLGEFVKVGALSGGVEDIGLRSTKLRAADKSLVIIPNKTVAAEAIVNLSRFTQRRAEQVIALTYDATPEQMDAIVAEIRAIILREDYVDPSSVMVYFRDYSASSLDIWMVYATKDGDFARHMRVRQAINLEIMRAVRARGLAFALPTQTVQFDGPIARQLADGRQEKPRDPAS